MQPKYKNMPANAGQLQVKRKKNHLIGQVRAFKSAYLPKHMPMWSTTYQNAKKIQAKYISNAIKRQPKYRKMLANANQLQDRLGSIFEPPETAGNRRKPPGWAQLGPTTVQLRTGWVQNPNRRKPPETAGNRRDPPGPHIFRTICKAKTLEKPMKMHFPTTNPGPNRRATKPPETAGNRRAGPNLDQPRSKFGPAGFKIRTVGHRPKPPETAGHRRSGPNLDQTPSAFWF